MDISDLHDRLSALAPIVGVSVGNPADKTTWRIDFAETATAAQQQAAQTFLASYNPNGPTTDMVDAFRDARLAAGFADTASGNTGKTWQCDPDSIGKWTAMAANAQPWALGIAPAGVPAPTFQPIASDNTIPAPMTAASVYALFAQRVMPWVEATVIYARTMKNNILAGTPPADYTQGWP